MTEVNTRVMSCGKAGAVRTRQALEAESPDLLWRLVSAAISEAGRCLAAVPGGGAWRRCLVVVRSTCLKEASICSVDGGMEIKHFIICI